MSVLIPPVPLLLAFLVVAGPLTITPGADVALVRLTLDVRFLDRMAAVLLTDRVKRRTKTVTSAVLMALGIRLALARR